MEVISENRIKIVMMDFIQERLEKKLKKEKDPIKIEKLKQKYQPIRWLDDAAKRGKQLHLVTHAIKFLHPDAKGSSINLTKSKKTNPHPFVSTHSVRNREQDVVVNAATLDVYNFLQLTVDDETILARMLRRDQELIEALPGSEQQKQQWLTAFATIDQAQDQPASHELAKQIYFPIGNDNYHLLAPLFPSALAQAVYQEVQTRYDDKTKAARKAKKNSKAHPTGYREYKQITVQKFGGTKPQNISDLNTKRGGKTYLLPSVPLVWQSDQLKPKPPLRVNSIFVRFAYQEKIRMEVEQLKKFLEANLENNNIEIRNHRATVVDDIIDQLLCFAAAIQQLEPGWSAHDDCRLPESQRYWLDPGRARLPDQESFKKAGASSHWHQEVSHDFANWLNRSLQSKKLKLGNDEYKEWKATLAHQLNMIKEVC